MVEVAILTKKKTKAILVSDFEYISYHLKKISNISKIIFFSEKNIADLHLDVLLKKLHQIHIPTEILYVKGGEDYKHITQLQSIFNSLVKLKADRNCLIVALGGGVIGDLIGFVASVYLRGVRYILIPTTLLACVDSSIGGKVAVNVDFGKNIVGSFYQPEFTYISLSTLKTLPVKEWICGMAEVIKYGFLLSEEFYEKIKTFQLQDIMTNESLLQEIVLDSIQYKIKIITEDEKETSLRKILNLGHTTAHAIESLTNYNQFSHGEAVAIGLVTCLLLSIKRSNLDNKYLKELLIILKNFQLPYSFQEEPQKIIEHMFYDKKNLNDKINFVLLESIGKTKIIELHQTDIFQALIEQKSFL